MEHDICDTLHFVINLLQQLLALVVLCATFRVRRTRRKLCVKACGTRRWKIPYQWSASRVLNTRHWVLILTFPPNQRSIELDRSLQRCLQKSGVQFLFHSVSQWGSVTQLPPLLWQPVIRFSRGVMSCRLQPGFALSKKQQWAFSSHCLHALSQYNFCYQPWKLFAKTIEACEAISEHLVFR